MTDLVKAASQAVNGMLPEAPEVRRVVRQAAPYYEGCVPVIRRQLTAVERQLLQRRNGDLAAALRPFVDRPTERTMAQVLLGKFFAGYPSLINADAPTMVAAYMDRLGSMPVFALARALIDIAKGNVRVRDKWGREVTLDRDFPPSADRIYDQMQKIIQPMTDEQMQIGKVLNARKVVPADETDPEVRARIGAGLKELKLRLQGMDDLRERKLA